MTDAPNQTAEALPESGLLDRIAREIALNIAADIETHYPQIVSERFLFNVKVWARSEVHRWFRGTRPGEPDMDARLRASAAHRRHLRRLRSISGTVQPGDQIEPILMMMARSAEQARLDYRAGGPVIEEDGQ